MNHVALASQTSTPRRRNFARTVGPAASNPRSAATANAAQSLRPRRYPRRTYGIHAYAKTLLRDYTGPHPDPNNDCPCSLSRFAAPPSLFAGVRPGGMLFFAVRESPESRQASPIHRRRDHGLRLRPRRRIVYSVYRRVKTKLYDALEHDDIWIQDAAGKRRRLLEGQKYTRGISRSAISSIPSAGRPTAA